MKVLLSPAKAIDLTKKLNTTKTSTPLFIEEAESLVKKLRKLSPKKIGEMMHLSPDLADLNFERYKSWNADTELSEDKGQVAALFNGEVFKGLDAPSMSDEDLAVAQKQVRILSGMYGLLKPLDVISPYRLEMGTKWAVTPSKNNLYKFWGKKLAEQLNTENDTGITINLASAEYYKAVDKKTIKGRVITPAFKEFKNGDYKVVMVYAKQARGMMARYIVKNRITDPEALKLFDLGGYSFDANLSTEDNWVFTR